MKPYLPSDVCLLCGKPLSEIGGKRIIAHHFQGVTLSDRYLGGGNPKYPHHSIKLNESSNRWVVIWGEKDIWTDEVHERARIEFLQERRPWFCQICGRRTCHLCGHPINLPVGSDVLHDDGCCLHVAIFPVDAGCINPECSKYRNFQRG